MALNSDDADPQVTLRAAESLFNNAKAMVPRLWLRFVRKAGILSHPRQCFETYSCM